MLSPVDKPDRIPYIAAPANSSLSRHKGVETNTLVMHAEHSFRP